MTQPPAVTHPAGRPGFTARAGTSRVAAKFLTAVFEPAGRALMDAVVLCLATSAALFASSHRVTSGEHVLAAIFPLLVLVLMHARRNPEDRLRGSLLETCMNVVSVVSISAMLTIALDSIIGGAHPVGLALRLWVFASVYLGIERVVLLSLRRQAMALHGLSSPTLIIGAGVVGEHLARRLTEDPRLGLRPVGFLDSDPLAGAYVHGDNFLPVLGGLDDLESALGQTGATRVILAFSTQPDHALVEKVKRCQALGVEVSLVPRLYETINERALLDHVGGLPLLSLRPMQPNSWQFAVKHAIDRTLAALALLAAAPLLLVIAVAVRLSSPGPILFRQERVGRDGRIFDLLKFRTMSEAPVGEEFELTAGRAPGGVEGSDRRTAVGRWLRTTSLDELPQFLNVLRGDMSLVGPRPERPEFVERFRTEVSRYEDRHSVRSGITGWAQVHGLRGQTSIADRVEWDNYYIQNWSLRLDLRILAFTIAEILRFRG